MSAAGFTIDGVDVFVVQPKVPAVTHAQIKNIAGFELKGISNRGQKVWPGEAPTIALTDVFRCRFVISAGGDAAPSKITELLAALDAAGLAWTHAEKLLRFNNQAQYSLMQGE